MDEFLIVHVGKCIAVMKQPETNKVVYNFQLTIIVKFRKYMYWYILYKISILTWSVFQIQLTCDLTLRMASQGYLWFLFVFVLPCDVLPARAPFLSPFFFLCNYHGNVQELGVDEGEVALSVSLSGNPEYYVPGKFYESKTNHVLIYSFRIELKRSFENFFYINLTG